MLPITVAMNGEIRWAARTSPHSRRGRPCRRYSSVIKSVHGDHKSLQRFNSGIPCHCSFPSSFPQETLCVESDAQKLLRCESSAPAPIKALYLETDVLLSAQLLGQGGVDDRYVAQNPTCCALEKLLTLLGLFR